MTGGFSCAWTLAFGVGSADFERMPNVSNSPMEGIFEICQAHFSKTAKCRSTIFGMDTIRSGEERKARLDAFVFAKLANPNFSIVQRDEFRVLLRFQRKTNHIAHLLGSIFTFGFWLPVWFILSVTNSPYSKEISIDEYGYITEVKR